MAKPSSRKAKPIQRRRPRQDRAVATLEMVLEAAARILREEGAGALNTNRIAARAGVSIGTLYGYFPDKGAIMVALARRMLDEDLAALHAAAAAAQMEPIRVLVRTLLARHAADRVLRRAVMSVHVTQGHGREHGDNVAAFVAALAVKPGFEHLPALRLKIAVQAALGVARALAEGAFDTPGPELEDEVVVLVARFLDQAS